MTKRCVFLTMDSQDGFYVYDHMVFAPLQSYGWQVEEISWRADNVDWDKVDLVVIRSCWDYQQFADDFLACLSRIDASRAELQNSLSLVKWNISKNYLAELQDKGVDIVPTQWQRGVSSESIATAFARFGVDSLIVKPQISANADDTFVLQKADVAAQLEHLRQVFDGRDCMLQPFIAAIKDEGEYSLFYFDGEYSHCIVKRPKSGDFRVQEEHGGQLHSVIPDTDLRLAGAEVMAALPESPLYARVDLIRLEGRLVVMEVELIEPSLYFNMDDASASRFARAINARFG